MNSIKKQMTLLANAVTITLLSNSLLLSDPAHAQVKEAAGAVTGFFLLGQLEAIANNLPNKISYEGSSVAFQTIQQVRLAIEDFKRAYASSLNVTIDKLDPVISKKLNELSKIVKDVDAAVTDKFDRLDSLGDQAAGLVATLPGVTHSRVTKYDPMLTYPNEAKKTFPFSVTGTGFNSRAELSVNGITYKPVSVTDTKIFFDLPSNILTTSLTEKKATQLNLKYENKDRSIVDTLTWQNEFATTPLAIYTLPKQFGTFTCAIRTTSPAPPLAQTTERGPFEVATSQQQGVFDTTPFIDERNFTVNATPGGWKIDVNSLRWNTDSAPKPDLAESAFRGFENVSETSFQVHLFCRTKYCLKGHAWLKGTVSFRETLEQPNIIAPAEGYTTMSTGPLYWGKPVVLTVPANTHAILLTVKRFDGIEHPFTPDGDALSTKVVYKDPEKTLVIAPNVVAKEFLGN